MKKLFLVILSAALFSSCEKDDICSDETTSRVIIEFFNVSETNSNLNVSNLKIVDLHLNKEYKIFNGVSKIELPLRVLNDTTSYKFILNSSNPSLANEDIITFNYTREQQFVSRACGFKTVFSLNQNNGLIHEDSTLTDLEWIKNISIEKSTINTENETHIKIYF